MLNNKYHDCILNKYITFYLEFTNSIPRKLGHAPSQRLTLIAQVIKRNRNVCVPLQFVCLALFHCSIYNCSTEQWRA